jgi:hypothetical protein
VRVCFPCALLDEKENECIVVEKKKHDEHLSKYTSEDVIKERFEAKEMLRI